MAHSGEVVIAEGIPAPSQQLSTVESFLRGPIPSEYPRFDFRAIVERLDVFLEGMQLKGDSFVLQLYHMPTECENQTIEVHAQLPDELLIAVACSSSGATEREARFRLQRSSGDTSEWHIDPQLVENGFDDRYARWFFCSRVLPAIMANSRAVSDLEVDILTHRQQQPRITSGDPDKMAGGTTLMDEIMLRYPDPAEASAHPTHGGIVAALAALFRIRAYPKTT